MNTSALILLGGSVAVLVFLQKDDVDRARTAAWIGAGTGVVWLVAGPFIARKLGA